MTEYVETIVVGGGQAGLAMGYQLAERGLPFAILDANARTGDAWRTRWDSLRLFTPRQYSALPGLPMARPAHLSPTKDEMADYLEAYAAHFALPVRHGVRVDGLTRRGDRYVVTAGDDRYEADRVVVASGAHQVPHTPDFAAALDPRIVQLHALDYRNTGQFQDGDVLLVGAGNSGADIAMDVVRERRTWLAGRHPGHVPFRIETPVARVLIHVVRFVGHHVLNWGTPIGRKVLPKMIPGGDPLIRVKPKDLDAAGVQRVGRVTGAEDGRPVLEDGTVLEVANVVWCTGSHPAFGWIDLPVFGPDGAPRHVRGVAEGEPGLYFVGLEWLYSATSASITGLGRDTGYVARTIAARARATRRLVAAS